MFNPFDFMLEGGGGGGEGRRLNMCRSIGSSDAAAAAFADRIPKRRMIAAAAISQATAPLSAFVVEAAAEAASADCERRLYNKLLGISTERRRRHR